MGLWGATARHYVVTACGRLIQRHAERAWSDNYKIKPRDPTIVATSTNTRSSACRQRQGRRRDRALQASPGRDSGVRMYWTAQRAPSSACPCADRIGGDSPRPGGWPPAQQAAGFAAGDSGLECAFPVTAPAGRTVAPSTGGSAAPRAMTVTATASTASTATAPRESPGPAPPFLGSRGWRVPPGRRTQSILGAQRKLKTTQQK